MRKIMLGLSSFFLVLMLSFPLPAEVSIVQNLHVTAVKLDDPASLPPNVFLCTVHADKVLQPVKRELFGTNVEWFNNGNGLWIENKGLDSNLVNLARDAGLSLIRFPGGTFSDYYHWQDGTGPNASRPVRPHFTDPGQSKNSFGSPELIKFCRSTGSMPLITVNAATGTAEEAAAWVDYMNGKNNQKRQQDGFKQPVGVKFWEVGNELYLAGNDHQKAITMTPAAYAAKFVDFAKKMRAADPDIYIGAIAVAGSYSIPFGPYPTWNETLLSKAAPYIDYLAVHNAYAPMMIIEKGMEAEKVYPAMWAFAESVDKDLSNLENLIKKYEKGRQIGIAITEWGPFFSLTDPKWLDQVKTLGSAVFVARIYQVLMKHPRVIAANFFKFTDNSFMGWSSYNKEPKVPLEVVKLYTKYFGSRIVQSEINSPVYKSEALGLMPAHQAEKQLNVIASTDSYGKKIFVNLVSCSINTSHKVRIDISGIEVDKKNAIMHLISGADVFANNGKDLPDYWPIKYDEPKTSQKGKVMITNSAVDCTLPITVPPHSIMVLEFTKK